MKASDKINFTRGFRSIVQEFLISSNKEVMYASFLI